MNKQHIGISWLQNKIIAKRRICLGIYIIMGMESENLILWLLNYL